MKLVYGISRWTNAGRASALHIDNGNGKPLCGDGRKVFSWEREEGEPTCEKCKAIHAKNKWENSADRKALLQLHEELKNTPFIPSQFHFSFEIEKQPNQ